MPCYDGRPDEPGDSGAVRELSRQLSASAKENAQLQALLDWTVRCACDMRTILRRNSLEGELTEETKTWIREHDLFDAERIKRENENGVREETRRRALAKLNLDERRVLGL